ncbi:MAG: S8 family peptidase [Candidatus Babeliales bacterium]
MPIEKGGGGKPKIPSISYEEARDQILENIRVTKGIISSLPIGQRLPHEFVIGIKLDPKFAAKSYYPDSLFNDENRFSAFEEIGSRIWRETRQIANEPVEERGKMFFVRTTDEGLTRFEQKLQQAESRLTKSFKLDIRKIHALDAMTEAEKIQGIPSAWSGGRIEVVLHPFDIDAAIVMNQFLQLLNRFNITENQIKKKQYDSGISFVSLKGNRELVEEISKFNPLRVLHPLVARSLPVTRGILGAASPQAPIFTGRSNIVVGMFDGGIQETNPYLENYSEAVEAASQPEEHDYVQHGTGVAGAILYGALNELRAPDQLSEPPVSVRSFRVLPTSDPSDVDLYEIIDAIETIVPSNPDIASYNLSLGPDGPILDDHVSRFTYACDTLAHRKNVLFSVAVGNAGEAGAGLDRIQSPSDAVNALGVGAYTQINGTLQRAPYSCIGPGREGNKLKPDISAFGGCDRTPMHLISTTPNQKWLNWGTSFASPLVASAAAQLIGRSNSAIDALTARAVLIHSCIIKNANSHNIELGHGAMAGDIQEITTCSPHSYTLIYRGELIPGKFTEIKIPWSNDAGVQGNVTFAWTLAICTTVDSLSPDDYTASSVQVSFYPNSHKYKFEKDNKTKTIDVQAEPTEKARLLEEGWEKSTFPVSESGPAPFSTEEELRSTMKWDTIDCREKSKRASSIKDPIMHIHALGRGKRFAGTKVKYALIVSAQVERSTGDLYAKILEAFPALLPMQLIAENQLRIQS